VGGETPRQSRASSVPSWLSNIVRAAETLYRSHPMPMLPVTCCLCCADPLHAVRKIHDHPHSPTCDLLVRRVWRASLRKERGMRKPIMILFVVLLCLIGSAPHACAWVTRGDAAAAWWPWLRPWRAPLRAWWPWLHRPRLGVSIWPYWSPYWDPYGYPPVVVAPPPRFMSNLARLSGTIARIPRVLPLCATVPGGWQLVSPTPAVGCGGMVRLCNDRAPVPSALDQVRSNRNSIKIVATNFRAIVLIDITASQTEQSAEFLGVSTFYTRGGQSFAGRAL